MLRLLIQLLIMPLPWSIRRLGLKLLLGFDIAPSARIGWSIILAERVTVCAHARMGSFNFVNRLASFHLGEHAQMGSLNWLSGWPASTDYFAVDRATRDPSFRMDEHTSFSNRHLIDCNDKVHLMAFAGLGGWGTQILTHSIDLALGVQRCAPVTLGPYSFVGTRCVLLKGAVLPHHSVLGAGSTLHKPMTQPFALYSGVPAALVRELPVETGWFQRTEGHVS